MQTSSNIKNDSRLNPLLHTLVAEQEIRYTLALYNYGNSGSMTASDFEMVNPFNGHFASVFTTEDISSISTPSVSSVPSHNIFSDVNFTQHDVLQALSKLRVDKAAGPDEVSARLSIEIKDNIAYPLFVIFRKSLDEGVVPDDWKSANISPVFKKGNRNVMDNYRPFSLTSQVCKVFESIIRDSMVRYLEDNGLIRDSQHRFRKGRSCLSNLL